MLETIDERRVSKPCAGCWQGYFSHHTACDR